MRLRDKRRLAGLVLGAIEEATLRWMVCWRWLAKGLGLPRRRLHRELPILNSSVMVLRKVGWGWIAWAV